MAKKTEVVINDDYGGFGLSNEAFEWLIENRGWTVTDINGEGNYINPEADICLSHWNPMLGKYWLVKNDKELRANKDLIDVVKLLKKKANGNCASLKIVKIPPDVEWEIAEYDGAEWVAEVHRTWC